MRVVRLITVVRPSAASAAALASVLVLAVVGSGTSGAAGTTTRMSPPDVAAESVVSPLVRSADVRLVTGDLVRLLVRDDGSVVTTVLPGSPHTSGAARWRVGPDTFTLPQISRAARRVLDVSLFNVSALERYGDRVPVRVRFKPGAADPRLPGLRLDRSTARATPHGREVAGSYGRAFAGLTADALADVASIRLAGPATTASGPRVRSSAPQSRVTVTVHNRKARPVDGVVVTLFNVQDGSTYQGYTRGGVAGFKVAHGPYSVIGFSHRDLVIAPELEVAADREVALNTGDATVKPAVSMAGYTMVDSALSLNRAPEEGDTFPFSFTGRHFFTRVQPTPAEVAHGTLGVGVSATLAPQGTGTTAYDRLAITSDVALGVPDDLTFEHRRRDFARVVQRLFANGPAGLRMSFFGANEAQPHGYVDMFTGTQFAVPVPSRRVLLLQAGRTNYQQTVMPLTTPRGSDDISQLTAVGRHPDAGTTEVIDFAHGPVGPGYRGTAVRGYDVVRREKGRLVGFLPLFGSSGSRVLGFADEDNSEWSLRSGTDVLARGRSEAIRVAVPAAERAYVLTATSRPVSPLWALSTRVQDEWTFRFGAGRPGALLTPRYAPPVSLGGAMASGPTSFKLAFSTLTQDELPIEGARLQLSTDDGGHWRDARLTRISPTAFRVSYRNPPAGPGQRFMSIRVVAHDSIGDSVVETAIRVYRLR